jgi:hypothetical protein
MNRMLMVSLCVLALALTSIPAGASPTNKNITVACDSDTADSDFITGFAVITLCDAADCSGSQVVCPAVGQANPLPTLVPQVTAVCSTDAKTGYPVSITISCSPGFKVKGVFAEVGYIDEGNPQSTTYGPSPLGGKGFFTSYGGIPDSDVDSDTVSLTIK